jgi:hypothetical protein
MQPGKPPLRGILQPPPVGCCNTIIHPVIDSFCYLCTHVLILIVPLHLSAIFERPFTATQSFPHPTCVSQIANIRHSFSAPTHWAFLDVAVPRSISSIIPSPTRSVSVQLRCLSQNRPAAPWSVVLVDRL